MQSGFCGDSRPGGCFSHDQADYGIKRFIEASKIIMDNALYFITLITEAFKQDDREAALQAALEKIKSLGKQPQYAQGYKQFQIFMGLVNNHIKKNRQKALSDNVIRALMIELATDTFDGDDRQKQTILDIIQSNPDWRNEYRALSKEVQQLQKPFDKFQISVLRDDQPVGTVSLTAQNNTQVISQLVPGFYKLMLSTGWLLWEGSLGDNDLQWAKAHAGQPFKMAADSGETKAKPTKTIPILEGELQLNIFAGVETGSLEIKLNG